MTGTTGAGYTPGAPLRIWRVDGVPAHFSPIPAAVVAGQLVFVSALRGINPANGVVPADAARQAALLLENLARVLEACGTTIEHCLRVAVYARDLQNNRQILNAAWQAAFGDASPSRFCVEVADFGVPDDDSVYLAEAIAQMPPP